MKVQECPSINLFYQDLSFVFFSSNHFNYIEWMHEQGEIL